MIVINRSLNEDEIYNITEAFRMQYLMSNMIEDFNIEIG